MISGEPVTKLIFERFPLTLTLALMGIAIGILVAIRWGVVGGKTMVSWDYFGLVFSQAGMAIQSFWLGMVLLLLFAVKYPFSPFSAPESFAHYILPPFPWALDGPRLFFAWPGPPWSRNFPRSTS
jgi:peptide/nickel transport system permease protein